MKGEKQRSQLSFGICCWWRPSRYCYSEGTECPDRGNSCLPVKSTLRRQLGTDFLLGGSYSDCSWHCCFCWFQTLTTIIYFHWWCNSHQFLLYCTMPSYCIARSQETCLATSNWLFIFFFLHLTSGITTFSWWFHLLLCINNMKLRGFTTHSATLESLLI